MKQQSSYRFIIYGFKFFIKITCKILCIYLNTREICENYFYKQQSLSKLGEIHIFLRHLL